MRCKDWHRELFAPCVRAGLIPAGALAGYRNFPVYLRTSRYVPPRWEAVRDAMPAFFDLLEKESDSGVRAVLGQWLFGYIHPYPDGNGRMARFLMNVMLASGGYRGRSSVSRTAMFILLRSTALASTRRSSHSRSLWRIA